MSAAAATERAQRCRRERELSDDADIYAECAAAESERERLRRAAMPPMLSDYAAYAAMPR